MKCLPKKLILLLLLPILATVLSGQIAEFDRISVEDGLSQFSVNCIYQDHRGFLWFGTDDGLNKYDGYEFVLFNHSPSDSNSLPHRRIHTLIQDEDQRLWVGTGGGLAQIDLRTYQIRTFLNDPADPASLSHNDVRAILPDVSGQIWIATKGGGINVMVERGNQVSFRKIRHEPGNKMSLIDDNVESLLRDDSGSLWAATDDGLTRLIDGINDEFIHYRHDALDPGSLPDNDIEVIYQDRKGALWIGTSSGLARYDAESDQFERFFPDAANPNSLRNFIWSIYEDRRGQLWIGTVGGLAQYQDGEFEFLVRSAENQRSISHNVISAIYEDQNGVLWFGTAGGGVNKLSPRRSQFRKYMSGKPGDGMFPATVVTALHEDGSGNLWIGTIDSGLVVAKQLPESNKLTFRSFRHRRSDPGSLSNDKVLSLIEDRLGVVWIGTWGGGLNRYDPKHDRFQTFTHDADDPTSLGDPENEVWSLLEASDGAIWVGTDAGLNRIVPSGDDFQFVRYDGDSSLVDKQILTIFEESEHHAERLWIGTTRGLIKADISGDQILATTPVVGNRQKGLGATMILCIYEDVLRKRLWFGTYGNGLFSLDPETLALRQYGEADGLPNGIIYAIQADEKGFLWVSTNEGLARFDPDELRNTIAYNMNDGLQNNVFSAKAATVRRSGEMLFGGISGFNAFFPDQISANNQPAPIVITEFREFDKVVRRDITDSETLFLSYKDNFFSFAFSSLDFTNPSKNRYAYRLKGWDQEWRLRDAGNRFASFTNLDGGRYTFEVRGTNSDGVWNEEGIQIYLEIVPPIWERTWFRAFGAIALLLIAFASYRMRIQLVEKQNRMLEETVETRTRELRESRDKMREQAVVLQETNAQLEVEVDERRKAEKVAEAANRAKTRFLTNMNHELRTPLNGILGYAEIIGQGKNLDGHQRKSISIVKQSGQHLLRLINDLLDLSRIEAGVMELEPAPFSLKNLLSSIVAMVRLKALEKQIDLVEEFDQALPACVVGDEKRLRQVLINLLNNAVKYTGLDAVRRGHVTFIVRPVGERIRFQVDDNGVGIPAEKLKSIFEPFYQVTDTKHNIEGTGLGLDISREIVELMGGKLEVTSEPGVGSSFWMDVLLPPSNAPVDEQEATEAGSAVVQPSETAEGIVNVPARAELDDMYQMIRQGDITSLDGKLRALEQTPVDYADFISYCRKLLDKFEVNKLRQFIKWLQEEDDMRRG